MPKTQVLTYRTDLLHEHRDGGFRCHGTVNFVVRESEENPGVPVVDAHCAKCGAVHNLGLSAVETQDSNVGGALASGVGEALNARSAGGGAPPPNDGGSPV